MAMPNNQGENLNVPKEEADHEQPSSPEEENQNKVDVLSHADIYQGAIFKYQPKLFGRDQGTCNFIIVNFFHPAYVALKSAYNTLLGWLGTTYLDAYEFCTGTVPSEDGTVGQYDICPFEAICPLGTNTQPLGGFIESLIPISNTANDWVQVSQTDGCVKYSAMNEFAPDWGVKGDEGMAMVNHVMCCLSENVVHGLPSAMNTIDGAEGEFEGWAIGSGMQKDDPNYEVYEYTAAKYLPLEFDRSKGWNGRTFIEALQFCGALPGYEICPYAAICPMGPDSQPLGGVKDEIKGSWAPILDGANDWVHIGLENQCIRYSHQHGKPPSWSITGVGNEEITRHIFCCLLPEEDDEEVDSENILPGFAGEIGSVSTTTADDVPSQEEEQLTLSEPEIYDAAIFKYFPQKYNRENGWTGSTYDEASLFCEDIGYAICPYAAICPLGSDTQPLGGYLNSDIDQTWMPVSDTQNDWVQVGESNSCILFSGENPEPPEWGITSTPESEVFTSDIMCCNEEKGEQEVENKEEPYDAEKAYEEVAEMYKPIFASRDDGWTVSNC